MNAEGSCTHSHRVVVRLEKGEEFTFEARWTGGKSVLVSAVSATKVLGDERQVVAHLHGHYLKKDGTASAVRMGYPQSTAFDQLPDEIQATILDQFVTLEGAHA